MRMNLSAATGLRAATRDPRPENLAIHEHSVAATSDRGSAGCLLNVDFLKVRSLPWPPDYRLLASFGSGSLFLILHADILSDVVLVVNSVPALLAIALRPRTTSATSTPATQGRRSSRLGLDSRPTPARRVGPGWTRGIAPDWSCRTGGNPNHRP